jgi:hypothetical protein
LRAILNTDVIPEGFKGNPAVVDPLNTGKTRTIAHELTTFNLSRYAYIRGFHERAWFTLFDYEKTGDREFTNFNLRNPLSLELIKRLEELLADLERKEGVDPEKSNFFKEVNPLRSIVPQLTDEIMDRAQEIFMKLLENNIKNININVLFSLKHELSSAFIKSLRGFGIYYVAHMFILNDLDQTYPDPAKLTEKDRLAISAIRLYSQVARLAGIGNYANGEGEDYLGRMTFSRQEQQAYELVHRHLFTDLDYYTLLDALRMRTAGIVDQPIMDKFWKIHRKYGRKFDFSFESHEYIAEASPFAEKPVCGPVSDLDLVLYPTEDSVQKMLAYISDKSFEHADGALAFAALSFKKNAILLEEIQTDIPDLFRRLRLRKKDERILTVVSDAEQMLAGLLEKWPEIILSAVKLFAKMHGQDKIYASSPWRIMQRYEGVMHPDKSTAVYFNLMQKLGGQLVHDDKEELGEPQYYWQFVV